MIRTLSALSLVLVLLPSCAAEDNAGTGESAGTGDTEGTSGGTATTAPTTTNTSASTSASTTADTTSDPATTDPTTTTDNSSTDDSGTTTDNPGTTTDDPSTTTDDPSTTGGVAGACDPEVDDDVCGTCVKESCCPELEACNVDADCTCFRDCAAITPGIQAALMCATECDISFLDLNNAATVVGALSVCTQTDCGPGICL